MLFYNVLLQLFDGTEMQINTLPKVVLHEHIEGSVTPALAAILAERHSVTLPENFFYSEEQYDVTAFPHGRYAYDESDFSAFIQTYDTVADLIRTPDDYYLVVKDFLTNNAQQGMIYCELIASPFHMSSVDNQSMDPLRYQKVMNAIELAISEAEQEFGVMTKLHAVGIRHLGTQHVHEVVDFITQYPRDSVVGFNIAGDERAGKFAEFKCLLPKLKTFGLGRAYHAGEICSATSVNHALDAGAMRIGHGIQSIHDEETIQRLIDGKVTLEVAISSNLILIETYASQQAEHPVKRLYNLGVRISLNTDDAGMFGTTIGKEYRIAAERFGFNRVELLDISLCAIEAAFIDDDVKYPLLSKVYQSFTTEDQRMLESMLRLSTITAALKQRLMMREQVLKQINSK